MLRPRSVVARGPCQRLNTALPSPWPGVTAARTVNKKIRRMRLFLPRPRARDALRVSRDSHCAPVATGAHRAGDSFLSCGRGGAGARGEHRFKPARDIGEYFADRRGAVLANEQHAAIAAVGKARFKREARQDWHRSLACNSMEIAVGP